MEGHMMKFSEPIITNEQVSFTQTQNSKIMQNIINKAQKLDEQIFFNKIWSSVMVHARNSGNAPF